MLQVFCNYIVIIGNVYRCVVCKVELPEYYYEKDNVPFCKDHYYEKLAHKCYQCSDYITGPTMV